MATKIDGNEEEEVSKLEEGTLVAAAAVACPCPSPSPSPLVLTIQKVMAEVIGTYFVIFTGCGSVVVNKIYGSVTFPGICVVWGLIVMAMVYTVGHISGAHFNPAVTITFAIFRRFPFWQVPIYIVAQVLGSLLASCTLDLMFEVTPENFFGTVPAGSNIQSLVIEIIITFLLMFVISGVGTDNRSVGELAGVVVGMTILLNVFVAGPISGASMNPARSIGPAIVKRQFKGLWVYIIGPLIGAIAGAFVYNLMRFTDKPLSEITEAAHSSSVAEIITLKPSQNHLTLDHLPDLFLFLSLTISSPWPHLQRLFISLGTNTGSRWFLLWPNIPLTSSLIHGSRAASTVVFEQSGATKSVAPGCLRFGVTTVFFRRFQQLKRAASSVSAWVFLPSIFQRILSSGSLNPFVFGQFRHWVPISTGDRILEFERSWDPGQQA